MNVTATMWELKCDYDKYRKAHKDAVKNIMFLTGQNEQYARNIVNKLIVKGDKQ